MAKNQKIMSDVEKEKLVDGRAKRRIESEHDTEVLEEVKVSLIEQEKQHLPTILATRTSELAKILEEESDIPYQRIYGLIAKRNMFATRNTYSNDELNIALQEFMRVVAMVSETQPSFIPNKELFCAYLGISTVTYNSWQKSTDENRREVMSMIDDYIIGTQVTLSQHRKVDNFSTIARAKMQHGWVESQAPIVIEHKNVADIGSIMEKVNKLRGEVIDATFKEKGNK